MYKTEHPLLLHTLRTDLSGVGSTQSTLYFYAHTHRTDLSCVCITQSTLYFYTHSGPTHPVYVLHRALSTFTHTHTQDWPILRMYYTEHSLLLHTHTHTGLTDPEDLLNGGGRQVIDVEVPRAGTSAGTDGDSWALLFLWRPIVHRKLIVGHPENVLYCDQLKKNGSHTLKYCLQLLILLIQKSWE